MSARMNGYSSDRSSREQRPSSEQMADLHVYLVPPDIWREKYHNALNQNINDTISLGFLRVHPETKIYALRDEIEQQLGTELVPKEYVFVKSVGRSLTRLKARQEATLKVKNFLPPQAYAPELYLLEATPEVQQQIAASSENSTRPPSRTSYDYEFMQRQSEENFQAAKHGRVSNGTTFNSHYAPLPQITPRIAGHGEHSPPVIVETAASPREPSAKEVTYQNGYPSTKPFLDVDWISYNNQNTDNAGVKHYNQSVTNDTLVDHSAPSLIGSDPRSGSAQTLDPSQHHVASSPRRVQYRESQREPQGAHQHREDLLHPLSGTPPPNDSEKDKSSKEHHGKQHKHDEDSGIAGFTPETYRDNEPLDRRKAGADRNDRLKSPEVNDRHQQNENDEEESDWDRRRREERERAQREEEERRRREQEQNERDSQERDDIAQQAKLLKTNSDEELTRYPSPPPLRLASPDRDTASARARRKKQKEELLRELEEAREERRAAERQREELVKHAKQMQMKTQNRRNHARDLWKKRYYEEKKKTVPLEEQCNRLRHELDIIHKKLLTTLEGPKEKATKLNDIKPSNKVGSPGRTVNNFKLQATRLQHEIEDIRRRVDHAKMKLSSEMKLRNQAETELRALRAELMQKKINLTLSRNSHLTTYAPPAADVNLISARAGLTPRS